MFLGYHGDDAAAAAAAEAVSQAGGRPHLVKADAGTPEGCAAMAEAARALAGRLDQVVHCVVDAYASTALAADPARFARAVTTNGTSLLFLVQAVLPLLASGSTVFYLTSRGGRIVVSELCRGRRREGARGKPDALPRGRTRAARRPDQRDCARHRRDRRRAGHCSARRLATSFEPPPATIRLGEGSGTRTTPTSCVWLASPAAEFIQGQVIFVNGGANLSA